MAQLSGYGARIDDQAFSVLQKKLARLPAQMRRRVENHAMRSAAIVVRDEAKATTAFTDRTGNLRRSIGVTQDVDGLGWKARATAPYAWIVENGSERGQRPRRFMLKAWLDTQQKQLAAAARTAAAALKTLTS